MASAQAEGGIKEEDLPDPDRYREMLDEWLNADPERPSDNPELDELMEVLGVSGKMDSNAPGKSSDRLAGVEGVTVVTEA